MGRSSLFRENVKKFINILSGPTVTVIMMFGALSADITLNIINYTKEGKYPPQLVRGNVSG